MDKEGIVSLLLDVKSSQFLTDMRNKCDNTGEHKPRERIWAKWQLAAHGSMPPTYHDSSLVMPGSTWEYWQNNYKHWPEDCCCSSPMTEYDSRPPGHTWGTPGNTSYSLGSTWATPGKNRPCDGCCFSVMTDYGSSTCRHLVTPAGIRLSLSPRFSIGPSTQIGDIQVTWQETGSANGGAVNQRVFHTMVEICSFNKITKENKNLTVIKVPGLGGGEEKI